MSIKNPQCAYCGSNNTSKASNVYGGFAGCFWFFGLLLLPLIIIFRPIGLVFFIMFIVAKYNEIKKKKPVQYSCMKCKKFFKVEKEYTKDDKIKELYKQIEKLEK